MPATPELRVVAAAIVRDGQVLVARRAPDMSQPGLWEFPGGKVAPDEADESALVREIDEELRCTVAVEDFIAENLHDYGEVIVRLVLYRCRLVRGTPTRTEHDRLAWVSPGELRTLALAPADIPLVEHLALRSW